MSDAEETLHSVLYKELDERGYEPRDVKVQAISSGGANYTSKIFLVDVTSSKEDLKLFAKVAIIGGHLRQIMSADWLFATERLTYTKIAKLYDNIQKKYELPEVDKLRFPKFYGCSDEYGKETIIMENLVASGYKPFNRFKSMDWEHACASVEYLAKFHALSFALAKDYPKDFEKLSEMQYELGTEEFDDEARKSQWTNIISAAIAVVKDEQKSRLLKFFQSMTKFNAYNKPIGKPVLSHGDFRISNLLFKAELAVVYCDARMFDAEQILRCVLDKELDERGLASRNVEIKGISSGGANYTSSLFLVDVVSPNEIFKLFAKVAKIFGPQRGVMSADWLYATERLIYTKVAQLYEDLQRKNEVPDADKLKFPYFFGYSDEYGKEVVIMENLVASEYKQFDRLKSMDWNHARASVEYLAKFHALSFALAKTNPEEFEKLSDMKYEIGTTDEETVKPLWTKIINSALEVIKDDQKDKVLKFFQTVPKMNKYNKPIGKPVLSHGDYRLSNLLFKATDNKVEAIAVDFQTVYAGCPPTDLIYLIFLGSDEEFRAEYYEKLLDHYYNSLGKMMRKLSVDPTEVYPREKFDSDLKEILPYAVLIGATILPAVVVEEDAAPDLDNFDYNDFVMSPNELFAKRFSGIVNDCIRWNVI